MKNKEMLEIIDEQDNIIGLETRQKVHKEGLLHREIHIWFITPKGEIIFQRRSKDKDTYPNKLDATVGGHVDPKMSYEETAVKECKEETGINIDLNKLVFLTKMKKKSFDEETKTTNNTIRAQYAYLYKGSLDDLEIEEGKGEGFEGWSIDVLDKLPEEYRSDFIDFILSKEMLSVFYKAKKILIKNMTKKVFLEKVKIVDGGFLTRERLHKIAETNDDSRLLQKLLGEKYIERYTVDKISNNKNYILEYYRLSEKGYEFFNPWYKKLWNFFTNDMSKIISLLALIISILVGLVQLGWI